MSGGAKKKIKEIIAEKENVKLALGMLDEAKCVIEYQKTHKLWYGRATLEMEAAIDDMITQGRIKKLPATLVTGFLLERIGHVAWTPTTPVKGREENAERNADAIKRMCKGAIRIMDRLQHAGAVAPDLAFPEPGIYLN